MIREFQGKYRFLSNFYPCQIRKGCYIFPSVEHAYQASKFRDVDIFTQILHAVKPSEAKLIARVNKDKTIPEFHGQKYMIMTALLRDKFGQEPFRQQLVDTFPDYIQEGNRWHDYYWGVDLKTGKGENNLGKILMMIRGDILNEDYVGGDIVD